MNPYNSSPDYLKHYRSELERQAISQAQEFLRRYGLIPPNEQEPPPYPPPSNGDLVTIPVTSIEQADNAPIDSYRTFIYPNFSSNEIYVKKTDENGNAETQIYMPKGTEQAKVLEDMSTKILGALADINKRLKSLEKKDKKETASNEPEQSAVCEEET